MEDNSIKGSQSRQRGINIGIAIAFGVALGVALKSVAIGLATGIALGFALRKSGSRKKIEDSQKQDE